MLSFRLICHRRSGKEAGAPRAAKRRRLGSGQIFVFTAVAPAQAGFRLSKDDRHGLLNRRVALAIRNRLKGP
jgi:hypothetical protein